MRKNVVFDAMILEATVGECPGNFRIGIHNTFPMLRLLMAALTGDESYLTVEAEQKDESKMSCTVLDYAEAKVEKRRKVKGLSH